MNIPRRCFIAEDGTVTLIKDKRADSLVWLAITTVIAVLAYWYPVATAVRNATTDDRFEIALSIGFPFALLGGVIAAGVYWRLLRSLAEVGGWHSFILAMLGGLLFVISASPLLIVGSNLLLPTLK